MYDNGNAKRQLFLTEKDCMEISAIKLQFSAATHLLCYFHAFRVVDHRLEFDSDISKGFVENTSITAYDDDRTTDTTAQPLHGI